MSEIKLTIDGTEVTAAEGMTILEAARAAGLYIPTLCNHPDLPKMGGLEPNEAVWRGDERIENKRPDGQAVGCGLCVVNIEHQTEPQPSCATLAADGMVVVVTDPALNELRYEKLIPFLTIHRHACLTCAQRRGCSREPCSTNVPLEERCCPKWNFCELQALVEFVGVHPDTPRWEPTTLPLLEGPLFTRDYSLCINCTRCVRACLDLRGIGALGFVLDQAGRAMVGTTVKTLEESGCRFCTACVEVCPTGALMDRDLKKGAKEESLVPCKFACPAGIDVPEYVRLVAQGRADQALAVIRERVPLPGILGRVCVHPCEDACRRGEINDPVSICALKRYVADQGSDTWKANLPAIADTGKKIAVIGAGPAGLAVAFYLRQKGHAVTVFEAGAKAGGMMRFGIPSFRLPDAVLDTEIGDIEAIGVQIKLNQKIDDALALKGEFDAVFIGVGAGLSRQIQLEGQDKDGVLWGVDFLRDVRLGQGANLTGKRVIVIGGGNVAVDVALTAFRQGAASVAMACLEKRDEMPAFEWEIQGAEDEGVTLHCAWGPSLIKGGASVIGLDFTRCTSVFDDQGAFNPAYDESDTMSLDGDAVILAIGQAADLSLVPEGGPVRVEHGAIVADEKSQATGQDGIFVGGDAWRYPGAIIDAIAAGRRAASAIDKYLGGDGDLDLKLTEHVLPDPNIGPVEGFAGLTRVAMPCLDPTTRAKNFDEIFTGFSKDQAQAEAGRCLQCDLRLYMAEAPTPPQAMLPLDEEHVAAIPDGAEGVYILYNEDHQVLVIKGTATLKDDLLEKLEEGSTAKFFEWEEDKMYSKAESERLQAYLSAHGKMPEGDGADELDDLF